MAKDPSKTEKATPKRRDETRQKGQVAKSMEVASVAILFASLIYFYFGTTRMLLYLMEIMRSTFRMSGQTTLNTDSVPPLLTGYVVKVFMILLPLLLTLAVVGFLANVFQIGLKLTPKAIKPSLSKLNPIRGFKNLFSLQALAQLVKSLVKISAVGIVVYIVVRNEITNVFPLTDFSVWGILVYIGRIAFKIILNTCWILLVLAILDYVFQRWQFSESIKMTKQEVKDEQRQVEGDPTVRSKIRNLQRQAARRRMMAAVPKADVVITNPTHIAVAISYDQAKMLAPVVIAKGVGVLAERIKAIAEENDVPIVENKPVAQLLYKIVDIDEAIPENLYKAVAEILAYVYGMRDKVNYR